MQNIKHIIVLVMENRSYEHIFGASGIIGTGIQQDGSILENDVICGIPEEHKSQILIGAPDCMKFDPDHELPATKTQLQGSDHLLNPESFVTSCLESHTVNNVHQLCPNNPIEQARDVLKICSKDQVPVLIQLAENFVVCDNWRAAIPSSTTCNRLFIHAATSGGLVTSPMSKNNKDAPTTGYKFKNGTIFDQLEKNGNSWKVYHGDKFPSVCLIHGMAERLFTSKFAHYGKWDGSTNYEIGGFYHDCNNGKLADYTFIEPDYGNLNDFNNGNCMHPIGSITHGESLVQNVYETLRASTSWDDSLLIVTFDESGGFYSSYRPETCVPSGDDDNYNTLGFPFTSLGMKVPALIISPWVGKNIIDHRNYEHSSIPKTIEDRFQLKHLTKRDEVARSLMNLVLDTKRTDCPLSLMNNTKPADYQQMSSGFDNSYVQHLISKFHSAF
jgi:phospholipase C